MIIELSRKRNLVWNHMHEFKIEQARSASSIRFWNHNYDFRPKLHDTKINYHFIKSTLKSHSLTAHMQDFSEYRKSSN